MVGRHVNRLSNKYDLSPLLLVDNSLHGKQNPSSWFEHVKEISMNTNTLLMYASI